MSRQSAQEAPQGKRRRGVQVAGGTALLVAGGALLVLPGPGIPLVIAGLVLLGRHYEWPRRLRRRVAAQLERRRGRLRQRFRD